MRFAPFRIERFYARYEFTTEHMLSSSDCESRTLDDLLALEPEARERLDRLWLGYTESSGAPYLRDTIATIYETLDRDDVVVASCAEEAILLSYLSLLDPGDHVIVETPCYESAIAIPRGLGLEVSGWQRRFADGWAHDLDALRALLRPETRAIYVCTPANPLGLSMPPEVFEAMFELAREHDLLVVCDEVYRELEHEPRRRLPAACDRYERAISLGSISKTYGLPGLRLGWLAGRDREALERIVEAKHYTTICASAPSELLVDMALRHRHVLAERNLAIVQRNLPLLDALFARWPDVFAWARPDAGPIGFPRVSAPGGTDAFCRALAEEKSVLLLPGSVYDEPAHVRVGYGRAGLPVAVELLDEFLAGRRA